MHIENTYIAVLSPRKNSAHFTGWALCGHDLPLGTVVNNTSPACTDGETLSKSRPHRKPGKKQREARCRARVEALLTGQRQTGVGMRPSRADTPAESLVEDSLPTHSNAGDEHISTTWERVQEGNDSTVATSTEGDGAGVDTARKASHVRPCMAGSRSEVPETRNGVGAEAGERVELGEGIGVEIENSIGRRRLLPGASIPRAERMAIGQMCKRIIDHGRLLFLQDLGFHVRFYYLSKRMGIFSQDDFRG